MQQCRYDAARLLYNIRVFGLSLGIDDWYDSAIVRFAHKLADISHEPEQKRLDGSLLYVESFCDFFIAQTMADKLADFKLSRADMVASLDIGPVLFIEQN